MADKWDLNLMIRRAAIWVLVLALPLAVNGLLWNFVVAPKQAKLYAYRQMQSLSAFKPHLSDLVTQSNQMLTDWDKKSLSAHDASSVTQLIQRSAERHRVAVREIKTDAQSANDKSAKASALSEDSSRDKPSNVASPAQAGASVVSVHLTATGRFSQLAHWLSELDSQSSLRLDRWTLTVGNEKGKPHGLTLDLTAFL